MDLEADIDRLYSLPLGEFITERQALAKALRAAGDRDSANAVKALSKPSLTAWVVNRLWHTEREAFDRLRAAAATERATLVAGSDGRQATATRRAALKELLTAARRELAATGHPFSPAARQRVSHSLEALTVQDSAELHPPPGRLTRDLEPPGFGALAGLTLPRVARAAPKEPAGGTPGTIEAKQARTPPASARKAPADRKRSHALQALTDRQEELATAERLAAEASEALADAKRIAAEMASSAREAEKRAGEAAELASASRNEEAAARRRSRAASLAVRRAASKVETAHRRVEKLGASGG